MKTKRFSNSGQYMEFKNISDRDEYGTVPPRSNGQMVISAKKDIVETRTFCYHGDETSHFFSLFHLFTDTAAILN